VDGATGFAARAGVAALGSPLRAQRKRSENEREHDRHPCEYIADPRIECGSGTKRDIRDDGIYAVKLIALLGNHTTLRIADGNKSLIRSADDGKSVLDAAHDCHARVNPSVLEKVPRRNGHDADVVLRIAADRRWKVHVLADRYRSALTQKARSTARYELRFQTRDQMALVIALNLPVRMEGDRDVGGRIALGHAGNDLYMCLFGRRSERRGDFVLPFSVRENTAFSGHGKLCTL
jgi:hypothetical protein